MKKEEHIVSYTAEQLDEAIARGESQTDWQRVTSMTDEEIEQNAITDTDSPQYPYPDDFWQDAELVSPKKQVPISLDRHIVDYFKQQGSGYQQRINAVLDAYVKHQNRVKR